MAAAKRNSRDEIKRLRREIAALKRSAKEQSAELQHQTQVRSEAEARATEVFEQQTATSEILQVISSSPTDVQPVFETIAESAKRLCDTYDVAVGLVENERIRQLVHRGPVGAPAPEEFIPVTRGSLMGRAVIEQHIVHVPDVMELDEADFPLAREFAHRWGIRTALFVPLLRDGAAIGVITLRRTEVRPFVDAQLALLQTFADQAVIAIENVRLFTELEARNRDLMMALDQQTATSEILRVISSSPTTVEPVFDAIVESAVTLCGATLGYVVRVEDDHLNVVAQRNFPSEAMAATYPAPLSSDLATCRAIRTNAVSHLPDVEVVDADVSPEGRRLARAAGVRSSLAVPLRREARALGAILVARRDPGPFSGEQIALLETFADQAVIAIENVRLFTELQQRNRDVTESLEQQTATAEILRVISSSPTDERPVFDAIAESAATVCGADNAIVYRYDGRLIHFAAHHGWTRDELAVVQRVFPIPPGPGSIAARAIQTRAVAHAVDIATDPEFTYTPLVETGFHTVLSVPMLRDEEPLGVISIARHEVKPFLDRQIALLQTFADQAVIAIENVRLFKELESRNKDLSEALEQQTATGEILTAISRSPSDVQPVFDAIARNARRLLGGHTVSVGRLIGDEIQLMAFNTTDAAADAVLQGSFPMRVDRFAVIARLMHERTPVIVTDIDTDPEISADIREIGRARGWRSVVWMPMVRDDASIGMIGVSRREPGGFADSEVALLETFAAQAVIAIENVRLFTELQARNKDLTEALDKQTATSEILRVISQSPTDAQPVFDTIIRNAVRLCGAIYGTVYRTDGELIHFVAQHNFTSEQAEEWRRRFPCRLNDHRAPVARVMRTGTVHRTDDVEAEQDPDIPAEVWASMRARGVRSTLIVPMFRQQEVVGSINVSHRDTGAFTDAHVELLKTFADQAVIAIENVRLFTELQEKNRALTEAHAQVTEALEQQTATSEILGVISRSPTDIQPVLDAVAESAARLCDSFDSAILLHDRDQLVLGAHHGPIRIGANGDFTVPLIRGIPGSRAVLDGRVVHVADLQTESDEFPEGGEIARSHGNRTILAVPLMRDGKGIGVILLRRREARLFTERQVALLQTFADQAVIAIENVRLFKELQARTQELTRSVEQLTALGQVGQAISSTLDLQTVLSTIVARATQLAGGDAGVIYEYDEQRELFEPRATERLEDEIIQTLVATPIRRGEGATGRLANVREPIQLSDIGATTFQTVTPGIDLLLRAGYRAALAVPLLREDHLIGALTVIRKTSGEFAPEIVQLLSTFATQSSLAIQNARLFREIEQTSRELEAASQHKSEFLASMSHELRTPLNAIIGFSDVLLENMFGELNEKQTEYLQDILASGKHLLSLINDILDLSKIEAGRMELDLSEFDLPQAIDDALMLMRERASRRGISLDRLVDARLDQIRADERKIKQVLLNLLSNAVKFTPEGGRIDVRAGVSDDGVAEISVTDTGVGIAPEDQPAVFEEFRQVGSASKKVEGTGLGLALCQKFVELHGGRIWVKSQVGEGSTFTFTIPVRRRG